MKRIAEPELMVEAEQVRAYAAADFSEPHGRFVVSLRERLPDLPDYGAAADLGCGPADITIRFARAFPRWVVDGIDGSAAMLDAARERLTKEGLDARVKLYHTLLPALSPNGSRYGLVLSNSLLHHLSAPSILWSAIREWTASDGAVFVMDLMRPRSREAAGALVATHAAGEPPVLQRDLYNSLLAAYRPAEVDAQLRSAGLGGLRVEAVSDRHFIVFGRLG